MKKYWHLLPVFTLILILLAGCGAKPSADSTQADDDDISDPVEYSELTCCDGSATLRFSRDENGIWHWSDDPEFPLNDQEILAAIDSLSGMEGFSISEDHLADYGLSDPEKYIAFTAGEQVTTYYLGKPLKDGSIYLNNQDDITTVYAVPEAFTSLMDRGIYDLAQLPEFPPLTDENIRTVDIVHADSTISLRLRDGKWLCDGKDVTSQAAELSRVLSTLSFTRCVDYAPSSGAASICGLAEPAAVMTVTYANKVGTDSQLVLTIGGVYDNGRFALLDDDTTIYQLPEDQAAPILTLAENGI